MMVGTDANAFKPYIMHILYKQEHMLNIIIIIAHTGQVTKQIDHGQVFEGACSGWQVFDHAETAVKENE